MAEIKITKKKPVWPWILLLLIIIGGLYFLFYYGNTEDDDLTDDQTAGIEEVTLDIPQHSELPILSTIES